MGLIQENEEQTEWIYTGIPDYSGNFFNDIVNIGADIETGLIYLKKIVLKNF